jgi:hypothetical protein
LKLVDTLESSRLDSQAVGWLLLRLDQSTKKAQ